MCVGVFVCLSLSVVVLCLLEEHDAAVCVLQAIQELKMTECKLLKIISATDRTCKQQKRELDKILNERDVLGSQLVRRNDEMSLLYEKTRLLTMLMNKGYVAYYQRLEVGVCGVCVC